MGLRRDRAQRKGALSARFDWGRGARRGARAWPERELRSVVLPLPDGPMMASRRPACAEPHTSLSRRRCWPLRSRMHDTRSHCSDTRSRSGTLSSGADAVCSADPPPSRAHRQPAASKRRPSIMLKTVRGPQDVGKTTASAWAEAAAGVRAAQGS